MRKEQSRSITRYWRGNVGRTKKKSLDKQREVLWHTVEFRAYCVRISTTNGIVREVITRCGKRPFSCAFKINKKWGPSKLTLCPGGTHQCWITAEYTFNSKPYQTVTARSHIVDNTAHQNQPYTEFTREGNGDHIAHGVRKSKPKRPYLQQLCKWAKNLLALLEAREDNIFNLPIRVLLAVEPPNWYS